MFSTFPGDSASFNFCSILLCSTGQLCSTAHHTQAYGGVVKSRNAFHHGQMTDVSATTVKLVFIVFDSDFNFIVLCLHICIPCIPTMCATLLFDPPPTAGQCMLCSSLGLLEDEIHN